MEMTLLEKLLECDEGSRPTASREAICQVIENATDHPDAETIEHRSGVCTSGVYRTLKLLELHGLVYVHDFFGDGRSRYEIANGPHAHTINRDNGTITDIPLSHFSDSIKSLELEGPISLTKIAIFVN
jgi:Fe2+ or Zn2+ uptake regulation protein